MEENNPIRLPTLSRIPGQTNLVKCERYVDDLSNYTKSQLEEIKEREEKLLKNKKFLERLPDKGKRIKDFYEKILEEINLKSNIDNAAELFSNLNITNKGLDAVTAIEWSGTYDKNAENVTVLDSDDDEELDLNPIKLLAQSRESVKIVKTTKTPDSLITEADLKEISQLNGAQGNEILNNKDLNSDLEPHAIFVCKKERQGDSKTKFFPHKTTKTDIHSVEMEKSRKLNSKWEVTAATPPPLRNSETKALTLEESIEVERKQKEILKIVEQEHARERLAMRNELISKITSNFSQSADRDLSIFFKSYRGFVESDSSDEEDANEDLFGSDNEVYDDEPSGSGGVSVVVYQ